MGLPVILGVATGAAAPSSTVTAWSGGLSSSRTHGAACYLARGIPAQWRRVEQLRSADSIARFEIAAIGDQSLEAGYSALFIASTECTATGCNEPSSATARGPQIVWSRSDRDQQGTLGSRGAVPLSITFQSLGGSGADRDEKHDQGRALLQLSKLISGFDLGPLRKLSSKNK